MRHCGSRRTFLKTGVGTLAAAGLSQLACGGSSSPAGAPSAGDPDPGDPGTPAVMPTRRLGKTDLDVPLFSLGGQGLLENPQIPGAADLADQIVNRAIDLGVKLIDTSDNYGSGFSEICIGRVMRTRRSEVFLSSKTGNWTRDGALRDLEGSLARLQTDHLDLYILHGVAYDNDLDWIFDTGGAIEALQSARDQGLVRYLGVSGHYNPRVIAAALQRFPFDVVFMAINAGDTTPALMQNQSFIQTALPVAVAQGIGVVAIKIVGHNRMLRADGVATMDEAMGYTLSQPVHTALIGCDSVAHVEQNVEVAKRFQPLADDALRALEAKAAPYVRDNNFYKWDWA